jgi:hypothetical protein
MHGLNICAFVVQVWLPMSLVIMKSDPWSQLSLKVIDMMLITVVLALGCLQCPFYSDFENRKRSGVLLATIVATGASLGGYDVNNRPICGVIVVIGFFVGFVLGLARKQYFGHLMALEFKDVTSINLQAVNQYV